MPDIFDQADALAAQTVTNPSPTGQTTVRELPSGSSGTGTTFITGDARGVQSRGADIFDQADALVDLHQAFTAGRDLAPHLRQLDRLGYAPPEEDGGARGRGEGGTETRNSKLEAPSIAADRAYLNAHPEMDPSAVEAAFQKLQSGQTGPASETTPQQARDAMSQDAGLMRNLSDAALRTIGQKVQGMAGLVAPGAGQAVQRNMDLTYGDRPSGLGGFAGEQIGNAANLPYMLSPAGRILSAGAAAGNQRIDVANERSGSSGTPVSWAEELGRSAEMGALDYGTNLALNKLGGKIFGSVGSMAGKTAMQVVWAYARKFGIDAVTNETLGHASIAAQNLIAGRDITEGMGASSAAAGIVQTAGILGMHAAVRQFAATGDWKFADKAAGLSGGGMPEPDARAALGLDPRGPLTRDAVDDAFRAAAKAAHAQGVDLRPGEEGYEQWQANMQRVAEAAKALRDRVSGRSGTAPGAPQTDSTSSPRTAREQGEAPGTGRAGPLAPVDRATDQIIPGGDYRPPPRQPVSGPEQFLEKYAKDKAGFNLPGAPGGGAGTRPAMSSVESGRGDAGTEPRTPNPEPSKATDEQAILAANAEFNRLNAQRTDPSLPHPADHQAALVQNMLADYELAHGEDAAEALIAKIKAERPVAESGAGGQTAPNEQRNQITSGSSGTVQPQVGQSGIGGQFPQFRHGETQHGAAAGGQANDQAAPGDASRRGVGPAFDRGSTHVGRSQLPDGLVAHLNDPQAASDAIRELVHYAQRPGAAGHDRRGVVWRAVDAEEARAIGQRIGLHLSGYHHVIDNFGIRHALAAHGSASTERPRGQEPVTAADLERVPQIVRPENLTGVRAGDSGNPILVYEKRFNGKTIVAEEVRDKRQHLALQTVYKQKGEGGGEQSDERVTAPSGPRGSPQGPDATSPALTSEHDRRQPPPSRSDLTTVAAEGQPAPAPNTTAVVPIGDLHVDPARFQYKTGGDSKTGTSSLLKGVKTFDPSLAGVVAVWHDPFDGRTYVVNGHHRYELAKRSGAASLNVMYLRAHTASEARAAGALINIAEGRGSALDAARLFRDSGLSSADLERAGLSLGEKKVADGAALAQLDPLLWKMALANEIPESRAVAIAGAAPGNAPDAHAQQRALATLISQQEKKGTRLGPEEISEMARFVRSAPTAEKDEASLFGVERLRQSLAVEKARLAAWLKRQMRRDKKLFGSVARPGNAQSLAKAGNVIDREASSKISDQAAEAEYAFDKLSTSKGPVAEALNHAADQLARGQEFDDVAQKLERDVAAALSPAAAGTPAAGDRGHETGAGDAGGTAVAAGGGGQGGKGTGGQGERPGPRAPGNAGADDVERQRNPDDVGAGAAAVIPWREARTGKGGTFAGYHGSGRADRESAYTVEGSPPILGEALYLADTRGNAGQYGPIVERRTVTLRNPLVLDDDGPWRALARGAGVSPNPVDLAPGGVERMRESARKLRAAIERAGHDGVIVRLTSPVEGDETKALGKVFGHDQIIAFNPAAAAASESSSSGTGGGMASPARTLESHPSASAAPPGARTQPPRTARIAVDPIAGGQARKLKEIVLDLGRGVGKNVRQPAKPAPGAQTLGTYFPSSTRTVVRFAGDLDTSAHEVGHLLDDRHGVVSQWAANRLRSPFDKELIPDFSGYGSVTKTGPRSKLSYQRGEGVAEWVRAWLVNPDAAEKAAPQFSQWFQQKVGQEDLAALRAFGDDVRRWAGLSAADKVSANIRFPGESTPLTTRIANFLTGGDGPGFKLNAWDRFVTAFLDDLKPVTRGLETLRQLRPEIELPQERPIGAGTRRRPPPAELALAQLRDFAGESTKLTEILRHGPIRYEPRNPEIAVERASGVGGGADWLLGKGLGAVEKMDHEDLADLHRKAAVYLDSERVMEKAALIRKETDELVRELEDRVHQRAADEGRAPTEKELKRLERAQKRLKDRAEARIQRLAGWGGGVYSDETVARAALEEIAADPQLHQNVSELAGRYRTWAEGVLRYMVDGGRLSEKSYGEIKAANQFYSAFHRVIEPVLSSGGAGRGTSKLGKVSQPLQRFKGSTRQLEDPYVSLLRQTAEIVRETDRNAALDAFADLLRSERKMYGQGGGGPPVDLDSVGSRASGSSGTGDAITVYHRGAAEQWQFAPDVHRALKGFGDAPDQALALRLVSLLVKKIPQHAVATYNPLFWVRQMFRMAGHLGAYSQSGANPLDVLHPRAAQQKEAMRTYGGDLGRGPAGSIDDWRRLVDRELRNLAADRSTVMAIPARMARSLHDASMHLSGGLARAAEFRRALDKRMAEGYSAADAARLAAHDARSLIDYAVAGRFVRSVDRYVMFMNAGVQHAARLPRAAAANPWGTLARFGLFALVPALAAYLWNSRRQEDLEEWRQLPAWRRDFGLNFKVGHLWWTIPMPYEQGAAAHLFVRLLDRFTHGPAVNAFEGYGSSLLHGAVHVDAAAGVGGPIHTLRELAANHSDFFGRSIIPPEDEGKDLSLRPGVSHASRLAQVLGQITEKAGMGVDARKIDYFLAQTLGGGEHVLAALSDLGRPDKPGLGNLEVSASGIGSYPPAFTARDAQWVMDKAHAIGDESNPRFRSFMALLHEQASAQTLAQRDELAGRVRQEAGKLREFYDAHGEALLAAKQADQTLNEAGNAERDLKHLTGREAADYERQHVPELKRGDRAADLKADIDAIRREMEQTLDDPGLKEEQRDRALRKLDAQLKEAVRRATEKLAA